MEAGESNMLLMNCKMVESGGTNRNLLQTTRRNGGVWVKYVTHELQDGALLLNRNLLQTTRRNGGVWVKYVTHELQDGGVWMNRNLWQIAAEVHKGWIRRKCSWWILLWRPPTPIYRTQHTADGRLECTEKGGERGEKGFIRKEDMEIFIRMEDKKGFIRMKDTNEG